MKTKHVLAFLLAIYLFKIAAAQQVTPATAFGNNGTFQTIINDDEATAEQSVIQQNDGKLLFLVYSSSEGNSTGLYLYRLTTNGELDKSFGNNGVVYISGSLAGRAFDVQPDGKIVVAAWHIAHYEEEYSYYEIRRYLPDGTLDPSFGIGGIARGDVTNYLGRYAHIIAPDIKVKPNGNILLIGATINTSFMAQLNEKGHRTLNFGDNGFLKSPSPYEQKLQQLLVLPDNRFITASLFVTPDNRLSSCLILHKTDGTIDSSMGTNGIVFNGNTMDRFNNDVSIGLELQQDNKLLVYTEDNINNMKMNVLLRYNRNGTPDEGFGTGGKLIIGPQYTDDLDYPHLVRTQKNGRIVVSNGAQLNRYYSNGTIDSTFGSNGVLDHPSTNRSMVFSLNENRLYITGTDIYPHLIVDAYDFCNDCADGDDSKLLTTAVKAPEANAVIKIFPNPVRDKLTITGLSTGTVTNMQLTDANGRTISKAATRSATYQWNVQALRPGVYYLTIIGNNGVPLSFKVIKQ